MRHPSAEPGASRAEGSGPLDVAPEVVAAARAGDERAFARIVEHYQRLVFAIAYRMTCDAAAAEDMAQEVFLRVWRKLHTFRPGEPLRPWLLRLATNACINALKKRRPVSVPMLGDDEGDAREPVAATPDAGEVASQREMAEHLERAIAQLPDDYRLIVTLRHVEELSYEEIAAALGRPLGTVKVQLFRARERLRRALRPILGDDR
ncbi:MAG TPA: sigma-70 family RNA polymerase sigma factor [Planctomycetota bacterium]|nr:sigma-70 family RNA polymerase sigma factor [Planctomycetota bacterium]